MKSATSGRVIGSVDRRGVRRRIHSGWALVTLLAVVLTAGVSLTGYVAPASAAECLTIPTGIEAWWPGNGTPDELVHGRDGALANGAAYTTGKVGEAFTFDGVDDAVKVPDGPVWDLGDSDFTQAMWVKMDATERAIFTSHDEGPGSVHTKWIFYLDSGGLYFYVNGAFGWEPMVSADWAPSTATWYHVAVTRSSDEWVLYVDGVSIGTALQSAPLPEINAPIRLGYAETNESGAFALDGSLDEVTFLHRGLGATEVKAIYDAGATGLCAPIGTALTMAPSKTMLWNGLPVTISGELTIDGPMSIEGQTITVTRTVEEGRQPPVAATSTVTNADGTYSFTEKPPLGIVRYVAWFEGSGNAVPASAKTTVTVKKGESQISLSVSDQRLVIGQSAKLVAKLVGGRVNRDVTIWAKPVGQTKRVIERGSVGADDVLTARVEPPLNTTYWATYAGDVTWTPDTSRAAGVDVRVKWRNTVYRDYARSGKYHLFHFEAACVNRGANCPSFLWELIPDHGGSSVSLSWQVQRSNGSWARPYRHEFRLNRSSKFEIWYGYVEESIGVNQRVRVEYSGDATHVGAASDWIYYRVTR